MSVAKVIVTDETGAFLKSVFGCWFFIESSIIRDSKGVKTCFDPK